MTMPTIAQQRVDGYLRRVRQRLQGMREEDALEIVEELRSHILDKATLNGEMTAAGVDSAMAALGSPEELASEYITDSMLARAEVSRSPVRILESLFHWASLSVSGFVALLVTIFGYFIGGVFLLCAVMKPFHPQTAGLWLIPQGADDVEISFRLGFGSVPLSSRDLLVWWIVPVGLLAGCGLVVLTTKYAVWRARRYRASRVLLER
jgi:hypothetical protein